jgi:hypothetical protein
MGDSMVSFGNLSMLVPKPSWTGWLIFIESPKKGDSMKMLCVAHNPFEECWFLGNSMKTKIPQHKLHSDRIAQKWAILCCGTKGLRVVNFKSDEKSDRSIDIFQPIRMLHFEEISTKLTRPTYEKSGKKSDGLVMY